MSFATTTILTAIENRLKALGNIEVYQDSLPDGVKPPVGSNGLLRPYLVYYVTEPIRAARGRHIVSVKYDVNIMILTVRVVAGDRHAANSVADRVRQTLVGWAPTNSGELAPVGGAGHSRTSSETQPSEYVRDLAFEFRTNLTF